MTRADSGCGPPALEFLEVIFDPVNRWFVADPHELVLSSSEQSVESTYVVEVFGGVVVAPETLDKARVAALKPRVDGYLGWG